MAYIMTTPDEARKKSQVGMASQSIAPASSGSGMAAAPAAPKQQGSGRFTNIARYVDANRGAVPGKGSDAVQGTINGINDAVQNTADATQKSYGALQGTQVGPAAQQMDSYDRQKMDAIGQADGYAGGLKSQEQWMGLFDNKYGKGPGTYSGPSTGDAQNAYDTFNSDYGKYQNQAPSLQTDHQDARKQQLRDTYGQNGNYTQGQGSLDSFLTERFGQPQFQQKANDLSAKMGQIDPNKASEKLQSLNKEIGNTQASYQTAADDWSKTLGDAHSRFDGLKRLVGEQQLKEDEKRDVSTATPAAKPEAAVPSPVNQDIPKAPGQLVIGGTLPIDGLGNSNVDTADNKNTPVNADNPLGTANINLPIEVPEPAPPTKAEIDAIASNSLKTAGGFRGVPGKLPAYYNNIRKYIRR